MLQFNRWTEQLGKLTIETCKRCGKDEGDWDDGGELEYMFQVGSYEPQGQSKDKEIEHGAGSKCPIDFCPECEKIDKA